MTRPFLNRRRLNIILHWTFALMLLSMIKGGSDAVWLRWAFVIVGAIWVITAAVKGVLARPGPKLTGFLRDNFKALHVALYVLIAFSVVINAAALLGLAPKSLAFTSLLWVLAAGTFHALFHLWRHSALYDNALRMIFPRRWHKYL